MKTDNYLTLCVEQAAKSPLHYRHGCVIVRGGKVIGQGYNDYRPGFDGGALKHGRIANTPASEPCLAGLKEKAREGKRQVQQPDTSNKPFIPFESMGGGHVLNTPLSMHSEMMAIHSALTASSTLSSIAVSREKPCFGLPRCDKRKSRLRKEMLESYVEAVCKVAAGTGKLQVQECGFEASASQPSGVAEQLQQYGFRAQQLGSGVSCRSKWRETPEPEEEAVPTSEQVRVRPVWTTDTSTWTTNRLVCAF